MWQNYRRRQNSVCRCTDTRYAIDFPQRVKSLILIAPQYDMPKFLLKVQNVLFKFMPESQFKDIGLTKRDFIMLTNSMVDMDLADII